MNKISIPELCKKFIKRSDDFSASDDVNFKSNVMPDEQNKAVILLNPNDIETDPEFSGVFQIQDKTYKMIKESIQKNGFDCSQPIVVWIYNDKYIVVDGNTRLKAVKEIGLTEIPVFITDLKSHAEILHYVFKRQAERRNLTQGEILQAAMLIKNKENRDGTGRNNKILGDDLGVSESTITNAVFVGKNADKKDIQDIKDGRTTINKVRQKIKSEKMSKDNINKQNIISDDFAIPDNEYNDLEKLNESISLSEQIDKPMELTQEKFDTTFEKKNEVVTSIQKKDTLSTTELIIFKDVLNLLMKHNENNAIKLLLNEYKNSLSPKELFEISKEYTQS